MGTRLKKFCEFVLIFTGYLLLREAFQISKLEVTESKDLLIFVVLFVIFVAYLFATGNMFGIIRQIKKRSFVIKYGAFILALASGISLVEMILGENKLSEWAILILFISSIAFFAISLELEENNTKL